MKVTKVKQNFSSPEPLGLPMLRCRSLSVIHQPFSKVFAPETAWPIKAKFPIEPPCVGGTKFCSRHLDHMTKIATTPIYGKKTFQTSSKEPVDRFARNLVCNIGNLGLS